MFATVLIALFALLGLASMAVIADSGLRWWSAFQRLRAEVKAQQCLVVRAGMRPVVSPVARVGRAALSATPMRRRVVRVAA